MRLFVPSVLSALQALLKCSRWFLWKIVNIFISWRRSRPPPPQRPSSPFSPHLSQAARDSRSQSKSSPRYRQIPTSRIEGVYFETTSQYHDHETPLQFYPPRRQPSAPYPVETPLSYVVVTEPVSPQPPRPATAVAPEVAVEPLVIDPHEDHESLHFKAQHQEDWMAEFLPQRKAAFARNEKGLAKELSLNGLAHKANMEFLDKEASANIFQAPEVGVEPLVIDPHEDHESLCFKARHQENWMAEFFRQSNAAFARNEKGLAKEPFLNGLAHKANMELLDREASAKIFQAPEVGVVPLVIDAHEDHESLRFRARSEGNLMSEYFQQATNAFARNEKGLAKELSLKGQMHKANMVRLNKEASAKIFQENNEVSPPNTVDLHRLYVTEAEFYFKRTVEEDWDRTQSLRVIVGKGNHSDGNTPKIKPAIQALGKELGMTVDVDPGNDGCLVVNF